MFKKLLSQYKLTILLILSTSLLSCNSGSSGNYSGNNTVGSNIGLNSNSESSLNSTNRSSLTNPTQLGLHQSLILADNKGFVYDESMVLGGGIQPFPNNAQVNSMVTDNNGNIYAGTISESGANVYELSLGAWQALPSLPNPNPQYTIESISIAIDNDGNVYAGITNSSNNGSYVYELPFGNTSWLELGTYVPYGDRAVTIAVDSNNNVYADAIARNNKTFVSQFNSESNSWETLGGGVVPNSYGSSAITIDGNNNVYVGITSNRHVAYLYELKSNTWNELGGGPVPISSVSDISIAADSNSNVYVSTVSDNVTYIYKSNSNSISWDGPIASGVIEYGAISKISFNNSNVYLAIQSSRSGASTYVYELISNQLQQLGSTSVPNNGNNPSGIPLIAVDNNGNVYSSIGNNYVYELWANTAMWIPSSGRLPKSNIGQTIIATDNNGNVYAVANNLNESSFNAYVYKLASSNWQILSTSALPMYVSSTVLDSDGNIYAAGGTHRPRSNDYKSYVYKLESGIWNKVGESIPHASTGIHEIFIDRNNNLYASLNSGYVYKLKSGNSTWQELGGGVPHSDDDISVPIVVDSNNNLYASGVTRNRDGLFHSTLYHGSTSEKWQRFGNTYTGLNMLLAIDNNQNIYAGTTAFSTSLSCVYELESGGKIWQQLGNRIPGSGIKSLSDIVVSNSGAIYVGSGNGNVYTLESGVWQNTNYGAMNGSPIVSLALRPKQ